MAGRYRRLDDGLAVRLDFARGRKPDFELLAGPQGEKLGKVQASNDMIACFQYMIFQIVPQESTPALHCRRLDAAALHERQIAKIGRASGRESVSVRGGLGGPRI